MPGFEQAGQRQAGGTAGRGAGASADFALDHDRARQALGAVIVGVEAVDPHKGEEFAHVASRRLASAWQSLILLQDAGDGLLKTQRQRAVETPPADLVP